MAIPTLRTLALGDLKVVRQRLTRYEGGEIAHIENVMAREERKRSHRMLNQFETTQTREQESESESRRDLESTERFEIENEIKRASKVDEKISLGLEISGGFGPVQISAYARYDRSSSSEEAERTAQKYTKEITEKAMERMKDRVRVERKEIERRETEEINKHNFNNPSPDHGVGVYRWVDKYYRIKELTYGRRLFYELVLPEPAAQLIFSRTWQLDNRELPVKPAPPVIPVLGLGGVVVLRPLRADDIDVVNYLRFVSKYDAEGVRPCPPQKIVVTHAFAKELDPAADWTFDGENIAIPDNYEALTCQFSVTLKTWQVFGPDSRTLRPYEAGWPAFARIHIGLGTATQWTGMLGQPWADEAVYTVNLNRERGAVPLSGVGDRAGALAMNLEIECERTTEAQREWQLATFGAIMTAYHKRLSEYNEKLTAARVAGGVKIFGNNPERNLLTIKEELKRQFLKIWMGADLDPATALTAGDASATPPVLPELLTSGVLANSDKIAFAEEAFDWDNIAFRLLPYFHGRRSQWMALSSFTDPDPVFESFLRSGAALVRIPATPKYTHAVLYYQLTGIIWSRYAGPVPALTGATDDPQLAELYNGYLAAIDPETENTDILRVVEIRDDDPTTFEIKLPTSLVWLQPESGLNVPVTV